MSVEGKSDLTTFGLTGSGPPSLLHASLSFVGSWWTPQKGKPVARILRICCDLRPVSLDSDNLELVIWEKIRTNPPRVICQVQCGEMVHAEDFELIGQVLDDVMQSAVGRTTGIAERLPF